LLLPCSCWRRDQLERITDPACSAASATLEPADFATSPATAVACFSFTPAHANSISLNFSPKKVLPLETPPQSFTDHKLIHKDCAANQQEKA
jgi:hypothetical protein